MPIQCITWVPLSLMAANRLDVITMWRGTWLSLAYVTGRVIEFSPGVVISGLVVRDVLCTAAQIVAIGWVVWWWRNEGGEHPPGYLAQALLPASLCHTMIPR